MICVEEINKEKMDNENSWKIRNYFGYFSFSLEFGCIFLIE